MSETLFTDMNTFENVDPNEYVYELMRVKGIEKLWGVQIKNDNFVVIAPTASGKTFVAELAMFKHLKEGGSVLYLVPQNALVSDKLQDFNYLKDRLKYYVTDPNGQNAWHDSDVLVTTFEFFFRVALNNKNYASRFGLVVFDEFHILYESNRGYNLEKSITLLKNFESRLLCLSATFKEVDEVCGWLGARLVTEDKRIIELHEDLIDFSTNKHDDEFSKFLVDKKLEPYLVFCRTRESTKDRAKNLYERISKPRVLSLIDFSKRVDKNNIHKTYYKKEVIKDEMIQSLKRHDKGFTEEEELLLKLLCKRIAFHNAGLDNGLKKLIEDRFKKNQIDYLFTTTTLAYGINFPAKTVILRDNNLWDPIEGSRNVPVWLYLQMAGRAGRPDYENEGYAFVVAKSKEDINYYKSNYLSKKLERAKSHISHDDFFRKSILELVYSGYNTNTDIIDFFRNTFYYYQSNKDPDRLIPFDLRSVLRDHIKYLIDNGFMLDIGTGYKLKELGKITVEYLFKTYKTHDLSAFLKVYKYIDEKGKIDVSFDLIYKLIKFFPDIKLYKKSRTHSNEVVEFFKSNYGISNPMHEEYTAYALVYGWLENKTPNKIEIDYNVYASHIESFKREFYDVLDLYEKMAESKGYAIPNEFIDFKKRVKYGVRPEELEIVEGIRGIGRERVRELANYINEVPVMIKLKKEMRLEGKTLLEKYTILYNEIGDDNRFVSVVHSRAGPGIGKKTVEKLLEFIKSKNKANVI